MTTMLMLAATAAITTLPYTYAGRLVNWNHQAYADGSKVTMRALNSAGEVLAKTSPFTADDESVNYRLIVPLATSKTSGYAVPGEKITLQVQTDDEDFSSKVAEGFCTIGKSGEGVRLDLVLATDSDNDGVPDEYAEYYAYQMGGEYNANADFDGDGQSNYQEYVAGTSPTDPNDRFCVSQVDGAKGGEGSFMAFTFIGSAGRTYSVSENASLSKPKEWMMLKFRTDPHGEDRTRFSIGDDPAVKTIYIPIDPEKKSDFFRINVE